MGDLKVPDNLSKIMKDRYYQDDETTPQEIFRRVSKFIANGEKLFGWTDKQCKELEDKYYQLMNQNLFIPSSPFLMNAGTKIPMMFACFLVGGIEDDLESIYEGVKRQGIINKLSGGTGFNFNKLREEGSPIKSTGGTSSGVMSFMDLFNQNGEIIKQGGVRRSANIGILHYDHPEIMKFINYKNDHTKLTNFNISVLVDNKFMEMVRNNESYNLISPTGDIKEEVSAKEVFNTIVKNNWKSGEPGILFLENINKNNPMKEALGDITGCNPCFAGDMKLLTSEGYKKFSDIPEKKPIEIINAHGEKTIGKVWSNGEKETVKLIFSGNKIRPIVCTPDHVFLNSEYEKVEASRLLGERIMPMLNDYIKYPQVQSSVPTLSRAKEGIRNSSLEECDLINLRLVLSESVSFSSNSISFVGIEPKNLINKISNILAYHGIENEINGNTIDIFEYLGLVKYYRKIGFVKENLNKELKRTVINNSPMVVDIIPNGITTVYDFNEPESHWGAVEGFIAHNCGEITKYPDEACCLGSINLGSFVKDKEINFYELDRVVRLSTRFLDTAIDINQYPDEITEKKVKQLRRIGLGIMGLHDMLIKMEVAYDSEEGRKLASCIMEFVNETSKDESRKLAEEKGEFPLYSSSDLTYKTRNVSNTTIAPTGRYCPIS